jgi:uncharacterized membrane protein
VRALNSHALRPVVIAIVVATAMAVAVATLSPDWLRGTVRVVAIYDVSALALLVAYWWTILRSDASQTERHAAVQDPGRNVAALIIGTGVVFGFVSALSILGHGPTDRAPHHDVVIDVLAFGAVVLGWLLIHTTFLFRYAHLYYRDHDRNKESDRGLSFPGNLPPNDLDFAYFAFVIGMTFQVSDVQITAQTIRRLVLAHGLISFGYSTAILALVVNIVSGLLH